jgi:uncharacterized protein YciI
VATKTYYAVDLIPVEQSVFDPDVLAKHTARLRKLYEEGTLILGGPFADHHGGLLVLKCGDLSAAETLMSADPLVVSGMSTFRVHTWLIGDEDNNFAP